MECATRGNEGPHLDAENDLRTLHIIPVSGKEETLTHRHMYMLHEQVGQFCFHSSTYFKYICLK